MLLLLLLLLLLLSVGLGIYCVIPQANHIFRACNVAAILYLQLMVHAMLFLLINITIIIIIIIIILVITFMQGIYTYVPETNHVSRVLCVATVLYLQFVLHVMLFCLRNMFIIIIIMANEVQMWYTTGRILQNCIT